MSVIDAISPKISPFLTVPMTLPFPVRLISPSTSRYILSLWSRSRLDLSFSAKRVVPWDRFRLAGGAEESHRHRRVVDRRRLGRRGGLRRLLRRSFRLREIQVAHRSLSPLW